MIFFYLGGIISIVRKEENLTKRIRSPAIQEQVVVGQVVKVINRKSWVRYRATVLEVLETKVVVECGEHYGEKKGWKSNSYTGTVYKLPAAIVVPAE